MSLSPQVISTLVAHAGKAGIEAESDVPAQCDIHFSEAYGRQQGSVVIGIRCDSDADTTRLTAMAAFSTDWSALIDKVEVVQLTPSDRALMVGLRNVSDSTRFLSERIKRAAHCISAAMNTVDGTSGAKTYPTMEEAQRSLRNQFPDEHELQEHILKLTIGEQSYFADTEAHENLSPYIVDAESMPAEVFERFLTTAATIKRLADDTSYSGPCIQATASFLQKILDRAPWEEIPGGSIVEKNRHTQRQTA